MFDSTLYRLGEKYFSGTPIEELGWEVYSRLYGFRVTGSFSGVGTYKVRPHPHLEPYPLVMDRPHRRILNADFEPRVFETLFKYVGKDTRYWEVGARWGTFSFAMAKRANRVVAFERDPHFTYLLSKSRNKNEAKNVAIIHTNLSENNSLDSYGPHPDVVTVDIEGSEYSVLPASEETLAAHPVWVVEAHLFEEIDGTPDELVTLFESYNYEVGRSEEEEGSRCRLIAVPNR